MQDVVEITERLFEAVLPHSARTARKVVRKLVASHGAFDSAVALSHAVGFRNRHQLARELMRERMPALEDLAGWVRTLLWTAEWEIHGRALSNAALRDAADPAIRYRTVERMTGRPWREVRQLGTAWLVVQLDAAIGAAGESSCGGPRRHEGTA